MFFLERQTPLDLAPDRILGLRISLNTPVMAGSDLPAGPGRAAIVVHEEPDGRPNVTIGIRSLRSGDVALYSYSGDLWEESSVMVGADAALSFAEGMGFLFDDDEVSAERPDSRSMAFGLWAELMGGAPAPEAPPVPSSPSPAAGGGDPAEPEGMLELDQVVEAAAGGEEGWLDLEEALAPEPEPEAPSGAPSDAPAPGSAPALTKFRSGAGVAASGPAPGRQGRAALGKLQLVKRRGGSRPSSEERRGWLLRLFAAF